MSWFINALINRRISISFVLCCYCCCHELTRPYKSTMVENKKQKPQEKKRLIVPFSKKPAYIESTARNCNNTLSDLPKKEEKGNNQKEKKNEDSQPLPTRKLTIPFSARSMLTFFFYIRAVCKRFSNSVCLSVAFIIYRFH